MFAGLSAVMFVFVVFGCVVLHEVGHALMARHYRIGTRDITLYPIGGVASLVRMPSRPSQELAIALAGPTVNVAIAVALLGAIILAGTGPQAFFTSLAGTGEFLLSLMWVNVALVVFNLLPAFPMDGGRVLRAFLAMQLPYVTATTIAARVGQVIAVILGLFGLFSGGTLLFVALFVFLAAQAELTVARRRNVGRDYTAGDPFGKPAIQPYDMPVDNSGVVWVSEVHTYGDNGQVVRVVTCHPFARP